MNRTWMLNMRSVMRSVPAENKHSDLTIIRKGKERVIRVTF